MSFFAPEIGIQAFDELEIKCRECGYQGAIPRPDGASCRRLIDFVVRETLEKERDLMQRASRLFDSFPKSNHRYIILKGYRDRVSDHELTQDCDLQKAVDSEPDLKVFLRDHSFDFGARRKFIDGRLDEIASESEGDEQKCPKCGAAVGITHDFYYKAGLSVDGMIPKRTKR